MATNQEKELEQLEQERDMGIKFEEDEDISKPQIESSQ